MPKENEKKPYTLTERFVATGATGFLTTITRNLLNIAPNYNNFKDLTKATLELRFKNMEVNVPRTVAAVFAQMLAIEKTKKQFGEEAKLTTAAASAGTGAFIATLFETPLIKISQAKQICPTAHFKGFTIVSDTLPNFSWNTRNYRLPFMYAIREFLFTVTVLTNETHLSIPKNNEEFFQFSYDLSKQIALYVTGAFLSAGAHKLIVPTVAREIFPFANKGTVPNIQVDGIISTFRKLANNLYTHPGFKGSYENPTNFMQKLHNVGGALCGKTMFGARAFYLVTTYFIVKQSLETTQKMNHYINSSFFNKPVKPTKTDKMCSASMKLK